MGYVSGGGIYFHSMIFLLFFFLEGGGFGVNVRSACLVM